MCHLRTGLESWMADDRIPRSCLRPVNTTLFASRGSFGPKFERPRLLPSKTVSSVCARTRHRGRSWKESKLSSHEVYLLRSISLRPQRRGIAIKTWGLSAMLLIAGLGCDDDPDSLPEATSDTGVDQSYGCVALPTEGGVTLPAMEVVALLPTDLASSSLRICVTCRTRLVLPQAWVFPAESM
jgi:hypothetical protein